MSQSFKIELSKLRQSKRIIFLILYLKMLCWDRLAQMVELSLPKNLSVGTRVRFSARIFQTRKSINLIGKSQFMSDIKSSKNAIFHATYKIGMLSLSQENHLSEQIGPSVWSVQNYSTTQFYYKNNTATCDVIRR